MNRTIYINSLRYNERNAYKYTIWGVSVKVWVKDPIEVIARDYLYYHLKFIVNVNKLVFFSSDGKGKKSIKYEIENNPELLHIYNFLKTGITKNNWKSPDFQKIR